jgi:small subunit ribosomal protein S17
MKVFIGRVTGTKMAKTAVVSVERVIVHPLYKKRFKRDKKYNVHDEFGTQINDVVKFAASKPYSKTKKWKILEVVTAETIKADKVAKTAKAESVAQEAKAVKAEKKGETK